MKNFSDNFILKNSISIENQYFMNINSFKILFNFSNIYFIACERYQKMSFRNRCTLVGSNGVINLSIPLKNGRNQKVGFNQVVMANEMDWKRQHLRTIETCYARSPFYEYYKNELDILFQVNDASLFNFNLSIFYWLAKKLKLTAKITVIDLADLSLISGIEIEDNTNRFLPASVITLPVNKTYPQVFDDKLGFVPHLSVIDLLFNLGPEAAEWLKNDI